MDQSIRAIHEKVKLESAFVERLKREVQKVIVGQEYMIDRLLIGILCEGHLLLEGVPGLAKTLTVKTLASAIQTGFQRIQCGHKRENRRFVVACAARIQAPFGIERLNIRPSPATDSTLFTCPAGAWMILSF